MKRELLCDIAERLMRCPAAPYHEEAVRAEAELICAQHGLHFQRDDFGNVLVRLETASDAPPLALAAHLDHPGFEILRCLSSQNWVARFLGGVPDNYFRPGIRLRLQPGSRPARLGKRLGAEKEFEIEVLPLPHRSKDRAAPPHDDTLVVSQRLTNSAQPRFAVWELEDFAARRDRIRGRACDDLIGVTAVLATLIELKRRRARVNVTGVISRAEEVGFHGALTVAAGKILPRNTLVVSLETSRELPPAEMEKGVIIRVGDRTSIFDSAATRFLSEVAQGLAAKDKSFLFQRALMSGGTCEATAYQEFGFRTAAVCIALGNYHNCGPKESIVAEFVSISDASSMVGLLVEAACQMGAYPRLVGKLPKRLQGMLKAARRALRK